MAQKQIWLAVFVVVLFGGLLYLNKDWFARRPIQISYRIHPFGGRFGSGAGPAPIMFEFDRRLKLTSVKVVAVTDADTNKFPHPCWYEVSDSNSVPTKGFTYGMKVPGMRPAYKGVEAEPLDPAGKYRLLIEAGSLRAQHDFSLGLSGQ